MPKTATQIKWRSSRKVAVFVAVFGSAAIHFLTLEAEATLLGERVVSLAFFKYLTPTNLPSIELVFYKQQSSNAFQKELKFRNALHRNTEC